MDSKLAPQADATEKAAEPEVPVSNPQEKKDNARTVANAVTLALPQGDLRWFLRGWKLAATCPPAPSRKSHENH